MKNRMDFQDDELKQFEAGGTRILPSAQEQGFVENDGARIWYATYGAGAPVILLHGGLGHSGNWGYQVPALIESGYQAILIDSRGHGRSTRETRPYTYELMASDVLAVMDVLRLDRAVLAGWSDGACISLILAATHPERVTSVFFFACNMDPSGVKPFLATPVLDRCIRRHARDYAELSATPEQFSSLAEAVSSMQKSQPNYSAQDLAAIKVRVAIVQGEHDEFIKLEHAEHLARNLSDATLTILRGVSHFAPLQKPEQFNSTLLSFVRQKM